MKTTLTLSIFLLLAGFAFGQQPENGSFEDWSENVLFENPDDWNTSNIWAWPFGAEVVIKSTDSHGGSYAARLEVANADGDLLPGIVMNSGSIEGDDTLTFTGGFPVTAAPDSVAGWFKYDLPNNDTALVAVLFKSNGVVNGTNLFHLTGSESNYVRLAWELDVTGTPDECIVAVTAGNPDSALANSWVMVDDLVFVGSTDDIPNGDFEDWADVSYEDPDGWSSSNFFSALTESDMGATESNDAHDGNSSLRLETVSIEFDPDEPAERGGYISNGQPGDDGFDGGQPYEGQPLELTGWYKYTPAPNTTDSAWLVLQFTEWDAQNDERIDVFGDGLNLLPAAVWTEFTIDIDYDTTMTIDSMLIVMASSNHIFDDSTTAPVGSVLMIDELVVTGLCDYTDDLTLFAFGDTTICDDATLTLDAGTATDYDWSTGATTQTIDVTTAGMYEVEVTFDNGCTVDDGLNVTVEVCSFVDEANTATTVTLFPNPAHGMLRVETAPGTSGDLQVYNALGAVVATQRISNTVQQLDLTGQQPGIYFVKLVTENGEQVRKLIIE